MKVAFISGTSVVNSTLFASWEVNVAETAYGTVRYLSRGDHALINRHGTGFPLPPHSINYRANIRALADLGFKDIVSLNSVGSLKPELPPGTLVSCGDYVGLQQGPATFHDRELKGGASAIANNLIPLLTERLAPEFAIPTGKVYVQMRGPRFETKAEIRIVRHWGDVIGMTAAHEADLCGEIGLNYNSLAIIDNYANGLDGAEIDFAKFKDLVKANQDRVNRLFVRMLEVLASDFVQADRVALAKQTFDKIRANMRIAVRGKDDVIDQLLVCLGAGGHLLVEDLPGVGKTTLAYALARSTDCKFSRIQFTSDLLPSDVTGVAIYDESAREFVFKPGPVFANIVLADEINRAPPKTQSALLEVMDRARVTVDGEAHSVGSPFMVFATQNPVDYEGTFPLPESQMDRFLMRVQMGYPGAADEIDILRTARAGYDSIALNPVATHADVATLQALVAEVYVEDSVLEYLLRLVTATRTESEFKTGASVRGGLALRSAAQARALLHGRDFVLPDDVAELTVPVFGHRLALVRQSGDALEERRVVHSLLRRILASVSQPA